MGRQAAPVLLLLLQLECPALLCAVPARLVKTQRLQCRQASSSIPVKAALPCVEPGSWAAWSLWPQRQPASPAEVSRKAARQARV